MTTDPHLEDRIARALRARASSVTEAELRPAPPPVGGPRRWRREFGWHSRWAVPLLGAAAVAAIVVGTAVTAGVLRGGRAPTGRSPVPTSPGRLTLSSTVPATSPTDSATPSPFTATPPPTRAQGPAPSPTPTASGGVAVGFSLGYEPLWPFPNFATAEQWRTAGSGSEPWHLDAGQTALSFTRGYLGFTEIDRVTSVTTDALGAHVGVGYLTPSGKSATAAVVYLVRFGTAAGSGWEVVGTDDTTFSLERPAYGTAVSTPLIAGGHITGVDENIRVWIRSGDEPAPAPATVLATVPAGGDRAPWSTVPMSFAQTGVLTVVASTGGHLQQVERFAVMGVHTG